MEFYYDEIDHDLLVLTADGGLNADTVEEFVSAIAKLVDAGLTRLIVDCSKLESISSAGLGVIVRLHRRMGRRGGDVKICGVHGLVAQIIHATHLDRLIELYPDVERARLAFRPRSDEPRGAADETAEA